jgi:hypothetical protein
MAKSSTHTAVFAVALAKIDQGDIIPPMQPIVTAKQQNKSTPTNYPYLEIDGVAIPDVKSLEVSEDIGAFSPNWGLDAIVTVRNPTIHPNSKVIMNTIDQFKGGEAVDIKIHQDEHVTLSGSGVVDSYTQTYSPFNTDIELELKIKGNTTLVKTAHEYTSVVNSKGKQTPSISISTPIGSPSTHDGFDLGSMGGKKKNKVPIAKAGDNTMPKKKRKPKYKVDPNADKAIRASTN